MYFFRKYFSLIFLLSSSILLLYVIFKSEIYNPGNNNYFPYYIISFFLIFLSIITFFLKEKTNDYIIIIFISITASLYICEIYLTLINNSIKNKHTQYFNDTGKKYDTRNRFEIFNDLLKINQNIKVTVAPRAYINDKKTNYIIKPLSGISNSEIINCNENGYYSIYNSDRYGFNNPDKEWDKQTIEYFLVGDSFTFGACVNRPDDISSVLRSLSKKSVLNLGQGGNGPLLEYATLREYLIPNVKNILLLYYEGNDLEGLQVELKDEIMSRYIYEDSFSQNLSEKQQYIDQLAEIEITKEAKRFFELEKKKKLELVSFVSFLKISKTRSVIINNLNKKNIKINNEKNILTKDFKKVILLIKEISIKNNSNLYFIYLPEYNRYKYPKSFDNKNYLEIKEIIEDLKIKFIDLNKEVFMKEKEPLSLFPFKQYGHYNVKGYQKIAEKIFEITSN